MFRRYRKRFTGEFKGVEYGACKDYGLQWKILLNGK